MKHLRTYPLVILLGLLGLASLVACGGGGGSTAVSQQETGTVALFVKDGPVDADKIWITIDKVALLPADEAGETVVLFESEMGKTINLLEYRDDPFLFAVHNDIPTGTYDKIRLWVSDIWVEGGLCDGDDIEIKLPSGKIDLNPRGGFEVTADQALAIELDVDLEKSINLHKAGKSGKCIFRPVIFVDIYAYPSTMPKCPRIVQGTIREILTEEQDTVVVVTGFKMALDNDGDSETLVTVLTETAAVFNGDGDFVGADGLAVDDEVKVRGRMNDTGQVEASLVVVGEVVVVKGVAASAVGENEENIFSMVPDEGQAVVGDSLDVLVVEDTLVLMDCDNIIGSDAIQKDMDVMAIGKIDTQGLFKAVAVFVRPLKVQGMLTGIADVKNDQVTTGYELTVDTDPDVDGPLVKIFLPLGVYPHIKGDGIAPVDMLKTLLACQALPVEIKLDPAAVHTPTAAEVAISPAEVSGVAVAVDQLDGRLITLDSDDDGAGDVEIEVDFFTTLYNKTDGEFSLDADVAIEVDDTITSFGLNACVADTDLERQIAFMVVVEKAGEPLTP